MNQREAFSETLDLAKERLMNRIRPEDRALSYEHLVDMYYRITPEMSDSKVGRWLGWAQAAVVAAGVATLDDMKAINMRHADKPLRERIADLLDEYHGPNITEGGCNFRASWPTRRLGLNEIEYDRVVDLIIEEVRRG